MNTNQWVLSTIYWHSSWYHSKKSLTKMLRNISSQQICILFHKYPCWMNPVRWWNFYSANTVPVSKRLNIKISLEWDTYRCVLIQFYKYHSCMYVSRLFIKSSFSCKHSILRNVNPLCVIFFRGNINMYLHFMLFLHIDMTQVVEILPQVRQGPTYST